MLGEPWRCALLDAPGRALAEQPGAARPGKESAALNGYRHAVGDRLEPVVPRFRVAARQLDDARFEATAVVNVLPRWTGVPERAAGLARPRASQERLALLALLLQPRDAVARLGDAHSRGPCRRRERRGRGATVPDGVLVRYCRLRSGLDRTASRRAGAGLDDRLLPCRHAGRRASIPRSRCDDLVAKAPDGRPAASGGTAGPGPLQFLLRTMLADRFKLKVHTETREMPIYAMVLSRAAMASSGRGCNRRRLSAAPLAAAAGRLHHRATCRSRIFLRAASSPRLPALAARGCR